jgi:hypothetical protein
MTLNSRFVTGKAKSYGKVDIDRRRRLVAEISESPGMIDELC